MKIHESRTKKIPQVGSSATLAAKCQHQRKKRDEIAFATETGAADTSDVVVAGAGADALTTEPGATVMGAGAGQGEALLPNLGF